MVACIKRNLRGRWTVSFYEQHGGYAYFHYKVECTTPELLELVPARCTEGFWRMPESTDAADGGVTRSQA